MDNLLNIHNIGYTAYNNPMRAIRDGAEFEEILPVPNWQTEIVDRNANVEDTVKEMQKLIRSSAWQTKELSKRLLGKDIYTTCGNVWKFLFSHIKYKEDDEGKEQLRTPALSWYIRRSRGIDCDDFSIFASTILYNLNIPHYLRIAKYEGKTYFQHVYVIVPQTQRKYITIDAVLDEYDTEKDTAETKDFLVMDTNKLNGIEVTVLSGTEDEAINEIAGILLGVDFGEVDELEGLGKEPGEEELLGAIHKHLVRTRHAVSRYPHLVRSIEDPETFLGMLDYGLKYWDTDKQELALGILEEKEEEINRLNGTDLMPEGYEETSVFYGIEGLGGITALGKTKTKKAFFKNVKKAVTNIKQKTKQAGSKLKKRLIKNNLVSVGIRTGMLFAMKTNLLKIAEKLKWGYLTQAEARDHGLDVGEWAKARTQLKKAEKIFVDKLKGSAEKFKKAILTGRAGGLKGVTEGLGVVAAAAATASVAAAMPFIKQVLELTKSINMKKLIGKIKPSKLAEKDKEAETMPEVPEDAPTATPPEESEKTPPADSEDKNSKTAANNLIEDNTPSENNQDTKTNDPASGSKTTNASSGGGNEKTDETADQTKDETADENKREKSNLPVTTANKDVATKSGDDPNFMTKVTDWVKDNKGYSALIVGGLVLAFSSGARKAIGLGSAPRKYKKRKGNKKNNPPKAISGAGKKNPKPKKNKGNHKPKNGDGPKEIRL